MEALRHILSQLPQAAEAGAGAMAWALAAGPALAPEARCEGLAQGVLRVRASSPAAARRLAAVRPELERELLAMLGAARFQRLEIRLEMTS